MQGSSFRDRSMSKSSVARLLTAAVACALLAAAVPALADQGGARAGDRPNTRPSESRGRAETNRPADRPRNYSEHQVPRRERIESHNDRHSGTSFRSDQYRHDPYGWYGTPYGSRGTSTTVVLAGGFGPTVLYDRWGRRFDNGYCDFGPSYYTTRYGYGYGYRYGSYSYRSYDSPSYRYRLVDVDPELAASRERVGTVSDGVNESDFHAWQLAQRDAARAAENAAAYRPGPASVSASPTSVTKGTPTAPGGEAVKPDPPRFEPLSTEETTSAWKALEDGRFLEAQALFSRGADAPAMPGAADQRAALSVGFALAATMLNREEAAAWALRRATDLDPAVSTRIPWNDALKKQFREAARRAGEIHSVQPTPDRAVIVKSLSELAK